MTNSFVLRDADRGYNKILSSGPDASYLAGHPDAWLTRHSSFNFHEYQAGCPGFGRMRVFGDEVFSGNGCGYNIHPHHNFAICAFVLQGRLTHLNTLGNIDELGAGDYYVFSAGSGGKHCELNLAAEEMHVIYLWFLPDHLLLPPSYFRSHYDAQAARNRIVTLVGQAEGSVPIPQDVRISRLASDAPAEHVYRPKSPRHGVYAFVLEGELECAGTPLHRRDSMGVWSTERLACRTGRGDTDVLFVETIM